MGEHAFLPPSALPCSSTQQEADEAFADLESVKDASYIGTMAKTLKSIHTAVKENQVVITEAFGPTHVLDLVKDVSLALDEKVWSLCLRCAYSTCSS